MDFAFIDNATIDQRSRKLIRSHVMKGKNAGRTVKRASRKPRAEQSPSTSIPPVCNPAFSKHIRIRKPQEDEFRIIIANRIGTGFLTFSYPLEITPHVASLLHDCTPC